MFWFKLSPTWRARARRASHPAFAFLPCREALALTSHQMFWSVIKLLGTLEVTIAHAGARRKRKRSSC